MCNIINVFIWDSIYLVWFVPKIEYIRARRHVHLLFAVNLEAWNQVKQIHKEKYHTNADGKFIVFFFFLFQFVFEFVFYLTKNVPIFFRFNLRFWWFILAMALWFPATNAAIQNSYHLWVSLKISLWSSCSRTFIGVHMAKRQRNKNKMHPQSCAVPL